MSRYFKKIIELRKNGKTYKEICNELDCAMSTVSYHCKLHKLGGVDVHLNDNDKKELQSLYDEIGSLKKVAKLKGHAYETVRKYVVIKEREKKLTSSERVILWRKRIKIKLIEYKGGKCEICGYDKCVRALQFHHKNPLEKDFSISGRSLSFDRLKIEVDKCMLVCSNCHCEIHDKLDMRE
jgi:5-methylcytosine-specific restriction endonuclease McrA